MTFYPSTTPLATPLDKESPVRVFSCLLETALPGIRLYLFLRDRDRFGTGLMYVKIGEICEALGVSRSTVYKWLEDKECFHSRKYFTRGKNKGYARIRYRALKDICYRNGVYPDHWFELTPSQLGNRMVARLTGTEAAVAKGQIQSEFVLKHQPQPKDAQKRGSIGRQKFDVISAERAATALSKVEKKRSETTRLDKIQSKGYGFQPMFRFFAISGRQRVATVSQRWVAKKQRRSETTSQRRLSAKSRQKYGLAPLQRRRVAYQIGCEAFAARVQHYLDYEIGCDYGAIEHEGRTKIVAMLDLGHGRLPHILYPNVYKTEVKVYPCKCIRFRINQFRKAGGTKKAKTPKIDVFLVSTVDLVGLGGG